MPGAMSWAGPAKYDRLINEGVHDRLGGLHAAAAVALALG